MNGSVPIVSDLGVAKDQLEPGYAEAGGLKQAVGFALLFLPFVASTVLSVTPLVSYLVAWVGSLWIFWLTMSGRVRPLPGGVGAFDQLFRPIVLTQGLFAFYMCLTSVFYVADLYGFYYFEKVATLPVQSESIAEAAAAQRYYVLAHAAVAAGMLLAMDYRRSGTWVVRPLENPILALYTLSIIAFVVASALGEQDQIGVRAGQASIVAVVFGLSLAFAEKRPGLLTLGGALFVAHVGAAILSGWKEDVLVLALLLSAFLYPYARRTVLIGAPLGLLLLLTVLPTFANVVRQMNWWGGAEKTEAAALAFEQVRDGQDALASTNWTFLTGRLSEIGLFTRYIYDIDGSGEYYGTQLIQQAATGLVPRALWPDKPNMEKLVMERVYWHGVADRMSTISAKPQYIVDGYLSYGAWGVLAAGMAFGLLASIASRACERWFGGYFWGSGLVYTSMFAVFWKGNSFEFFFPVVLWSFILLVPLFYLARAAGLILHPEDVEDRFEWEEATLGPVRHGRRRLRRA